MNKKQRSLKFSTSLVLFLFFSIFSLTQPNLILAQANDDQATEATASTTSSETTQNLKDRIEKIVSEKKEQIKDVVSEIATRKRGFVGQVTRVAEESFSVKTTKTTEIIAFQDETIFRKDGEDIEPSEIEVGNWLVIMGVLEDEQSFTPLRILVSDETLRPLPHTIEIGTITDISNSELTLRPRSGEPDIDFSFTRNSVLEDLNGQEIDLDQIEDDMQALIIAYQEEDETDEAEASPNTQTEAGEKFVKRMRVLTTINNE